MVITRVTTASADMILTAFDVKFHETKDEMPPEVCRPLNKLKKRKEQKTCSGNGPKKPEKQCSGNGPKNKSRHTSTNVDVNTGRGREVRIAAAVTTATAATTATTTAATATTTATTARLCVRLSL